MPSPSFHVDFSTNTIYLTHPTSCHSIPIAKFLCDSKGPHTIYEYKNISIPQTLINTLPSLFQRWKQGEAMRHLKFFLDADLDDSAARNFNSFDGTKGG